MLLLHLEMFVFESELGIVQRSPVDGRGIECHHHTCEAGCMASPGTQSGPIRFGPFALDPSSRELR